MPGHERAEAQIVINVFVSVNVVNPASLSVLHKQWVGFIVPIITGNTKRDALQGAPIRIRGLGSSLLIGSDFFL
jgi:hypothetical protein